MQSASSAASALQAADIELLHQSLRDAERRGALLTQLIEALNQSRDPVTLLERSVEAVVRAIAASGAFVYLWDSDAGRLVLRAATEGHQRSFVGLISLRSGEGLTGWSALMRRPVLIGENLADDPRIVVFPELQEGEFRSCLIVPILVPGGETLGVFSIYSVDEDAFSESDLNLVDEVAKLLASGIDRAHIVDLWERQSVALDSLVVAAESAPNELGSCLTDLAHRCMGIVPSDICIVESIEVDGAPEPVALAVRRAVDGAVGNLASLSLRAAKEIARSASPALQSVAMPMRLSDRTLGVITAYRAAAFTSEDRSLLAAIAAYGALALGGLPNRGAAESALGQLITAQTEGEAADLLSRFGWTAGSHVVPVIVRCDPELALTSRRSLDSVAQTVESVFTGKRRRTLPAVPGVVAAVVFGRAAGGDHAAIAAELHHDIAVALSDKGQVAGAAIGIGRTVVAALEIASEFQRAAEIAAWAAVSGSGVRSGVVGEADLTHQLLAVSRILAPDVSHHIERLKRLKEYDDRHGTDLLKTMDVVVRERGATQLAAEQLFIHRNTLRQRLNKISTLIDQPIEQVDDWLPVSLAIHILKGQ